MAIVWPTFQVREDASTYFPILLASLYTVKFTNTIPCDPFLEDTNLGMKKKY